jgi:hypothetical protein
MDPVFSWRKTRPTDLPHCLRFHPQKNGAETIGAARSAKAWRQLLEATHATRSALVEMRTNGSTEIVGFGLASFVKKKFAEAEVRNPRPGLNSRIIESVASGNSVICTYSEVREANTCGALQQVILETAWKTSLPPLLVGEVRVVLGTAYQSLFAGYRFSRILTELVGPQDLATRDEGLREFRVVAKFKSALCKKPNSAPNPESMLLEVTLDCIRNQPHSIAAGLFMHHAAPQFGLTRGEQELLEYALEGAGDLDLAKSLFVTVPAIKRRWSSIFARVGSIRPDVCPVDGEGTRGLQKRQHILTHLRSHPEELRPFNPKIA